MRMLFLTCLLLLALPARADVSVLVGGIGYHFKDNDAYNSWHRLVAIEYSGVVGAYFKNSHYDDTYLLGYNFTLIQQRLFDVSIMAGAMYGYKECPVFGMSSDGRKIVCPSVGITGAWRMTQSVHPAVTFTGKAVVLAIKIELFK